MEKVTEAQLQDWLVQLAKKNSLASAIEHVDELEALKEAGTHSAVNVDAIDDALHVLQSLLEAQLVAANDDIQVDAKTGFRPDLLFQDPCSGRWIIVELKVSHQTERQAITEVLAYAEGLHRRMHNVPVSIVVASSAWRELLKNAVRAQMRSRRYPLLPLQVSPAPDGKNFHLRPILDVFDHRGFHGEFAPELFTCDTKSFFFQCETALETYDQKTVLKRLQRAANDVAREGDKRGCSGLVILWESQVFGGPVWHLTTCIINPNKLIPDLPVTSPIMQYLNPANDLEFPVDPYATDLDQGCRLLAKIEMRDLGLSSEFSNFGHWSQAQRLLDENGAKYLQVSPWGEIHDRWPTETWQTGARHFANINANQFPDEHPFCWVPAMDQISGEAITMGELSSGLGAYKLGKIVGRITQFHKDHSANTNYGRDGRDSRYTCAMARLLGCWYTVHAFGEATGSRTMPPSLEFEATNPPTLLPSCVSEYARWAWQMFAHLGDHHHFCYQLGLYHEWSSCGERATTLRVGRDSCKKTQIPS
ncbi:hypothetical protein [Duganella vulcania]|uniref:DUF91 domain-containing protein n=1 Tax=Duganella vulcania TaxID=2692166 RepID=A0A845GG89_9BURK|nr:hypothetical protein [Duganella vulcania]MYM92246.1 hypothetical protein [Duganella vulcania]